MLQILFTIIIFFNFSEARLPSNQEASTTKGSQVLKADLSKLCGKMNIPLDIMVKCLEAGYIMKVGSVDPNAKIHLSRITGCDSKTNPSAFKSCLNAYVKSNPKSVQANVSDCWKHINEEDFKRCWGWSNVEKVELETTHEVNPGKAAN